jgi:dihydrofolate reductase
MRDASKIIIHTAMSLDGFVAGPKDDMSWVFDHWEPTLDSSKHTASVGAVIMGRKTQEVDIDHRSNPEKNFVYGGEYSGPVFVLSKERNDQERDSRVQYLSGDIKEKVGDVTKAANGGDVVLLGATVWREFLEAGLVDEILIHVVPVLLGDGVHFYAIPGAHLVELELTESLQIGKLAQLRFKVTKTKLGGII